MLSFVRAFGRPPDVGERSHIRSQYSLHSTVFSLCNILSSFHVCSCPPCLHASRCLSHCSSQRSCSTLKPTHLQTSFPVSLLNIATRPTMVAGLSVYLVQDVPPMLQLLVQQALSIRPAVPSARHVSGSSSRIVVQLVHS